MIQGHAYDLLEKADDMPSLSVKDIARAHKWTEKIFEQAKRIDTNFPCPCTTGSGEVADDFNYDYCEKVEKVATGLRSFLDIYECYCGNSISRGEKLAKRIRRMRRILKKIAKCPK